jgi:hypothetical protein
MVWITSSSLSGLAGEGSSALVQQLGVTGVG